MQGYLEFLTLQVELLFRRPIKAYVVEIPFAANTHRK